MTVSELIIFDMPPCRLDRPDGNAALIADLMKRAYVMEMCEVTLNLVRTEEGLLANGRAAAAMVQQGNTPLVTRVQDFISLENSSLVYYCQT